MKRIAGPRLSSIGRRNVSAGGEHRGVPEFLLWCTATQVHERVPGRTRATLTVGVGGLSHAFTT